MKRICGGTPGRPCGKDMGEKEPLDDRRITTGICESCLALQEEEFRAAYPELDERIRETLDA